MNSPPVHPYLIELIKLRRKIALWIHETQNTHVAASEVVNNLGIEDSHDTSAKNKVKFC
jgi:hypothetical protein